MWQPKEAEPFRSVRHMAVQYGAAMDQVRENLGGDAELMKFIEMARADYEANKKRVLSTDCRISRKSYR